MGDDIGYWNISAYNRGMMGYRTPNIDRIANEGAIFTDYYGQQSCTAGRAAFITGQSPLRTGLLKVGLPGAKEGLSDKDPTIAELLKPQGYATGQFGKNHLGDRNEFLPTVHGFDEFFGNLYHLNAEDEPEHPDYPKNPAFRAQFGPRGVMKCVATATDTPGDDPRFGPWGKQKCEDTGPLTKKRMETIDEEFLKASIDFIDRANRDKKPFFVWFNPSRMHIWTRLKPESQGKTGLGIYPDGMVEHDGQVGAAPEEARRSRHRQQHHRDLHHRQRRRDVLLARRRHHAVPRREEHQLGRRLSRPGDGALARPGAAAHRDQRHLLGRGLGDRRWSRRPASRTSRTSCCRATMPRGKNFKVHLDGYDQRDLLAGKGPDKRREFFYWTDDGNLAGLRYDQWKAVFMEQKAHGFEVWPQPMVQLRLPMLFNLRSDPFERAQHEAGDYVRWFVEHAFVLVPAQAIVAQHLDELPAVPAAPEARQLLGRAGHGEAQEPAVQQLAAIPRLKGPKHEIDCSSPMGRQRDVAGSDRRRVARGVSRRVRGVPRRILFPGAAAAVRPDLPRHRVRVPLPKRAHAPCLGLGILPWLDGGRVRPGR